MKASKASTDHKLGRSRFGAPSVLPMIVALGLLSPLNVRAQGEWQKLADMPVEKWEAGTVVLDDKLYLFGGYTQGVRSSKLSHVFDPKENSWTRIQDLPSAISHINLVLEGRTVWFAGGFKTGWTSTTPKPIHGRAAPHFPKGTRMPKAAPSFTAAGSTWSEVTPPSRVTPSESTRTSWRWLPAASGS